MIFIDISKEAIANALKGSYLVFITAGMGGGTGSRATSSRGCSSSIQSNLPTLCANVDLIAFISASFVGTGGH